MRRAPAEAREAARTCTKSRNPVRLPRLMGRAPRILARPHHGITPLARETLAQDLALPLSAYKCVRLAAVGADETLRLHSDTRKFLFVESEK